MTSSVANRTATSLFIVLVIGLQAFTTFRAYTYLPIAFPPAGQLPMQGLKHPKLWPFITYTMYNQPHYEGDVIPDYKVYAVFADSSDAHILPKALGLSFWKFRAGLVEAILENDTAEIAEFASRISAKMENDLALLRLEIRPWILGRNGFVRGPAEVIREVRVLPGVRKSPL